MIDSKSTGWQRPDPRSIEEALKWGALFGEVGREKRVRFDIPDAEVKVLADLLRKILRYKPEKRMSAREVLEHEWFKL